MRPFGCPLTILNTLDSLGKFDGKSDEGYLLGYSTTSKAFRVYNKRTKRVEEILHIDFLEDQPNVAGTGPNWIPSGKDKGPSQEYILLLLQPHRTRIPVEDDAPAVHENPSKSSPKDNDVQDSEDTIAQEVIAKALDDATRQAFEEEKRNIASQKRATQATNTNKLSVNAGKSSFVYIGGKIPIDASTLPNADLRIDLNIPDLEANSDAFSNDGIFNGAYDDENVGAVADFNNIDDTINVSPIPTLRIHKVHPKDQILGDPKLAVQTIGKIQKASLAQQALDTVDLPSRKKGAGTEGGWGFVRAHRTDVGARVKQQPDGIFISQDKYVADILKKFDFWSIRIATTPIESNKPLVKDEDGKDVDVHVYRSMIGSLMYLTLSSG
ncbi:uncharacterized mitochondrial protein-like protein [Tanacetum coccineum]